MLSASHSRDPTEMRCLGRRHDRTLFARALERPGQHRFRLLRCDLSQPCPTTGPDQEEQAPPLGANLPDNTMNVREIVNRVAGHQRVDLQRNTCADGIASNRERAVECAGDTAERVVALGGGSIETQRHGRDAQRGEPGDHLRGQKRCRARCDKTRQSEVDGACHDVEEIPPLQRIPARENDVRRSSTVGDLTENAEDLARGQLAWIGTGMCTGAAMEARKIARSSELPIDALRRVRIDERHDARCCNCSARRTRFGNAAARSLRLGDWMKVECVIVGGGISGLSAARELHIRGIPFVLVESAARYGGLIRTERCWWLCS